MSSRFTTYSPQPYYTSQVCMRILCNLPTQAVNTCLFSSWSFTYSKTFPQLCFQQQQNPPQRDGFCCLVILYCVKGTRFKYASVVVQLCCVFQFYAPALLVENHISIPIRAVLHRPLLCLMINTGKSHSMTVTTIPLEIVDH